MQSETANLNMKNLKCSPKLFSRDIPFLSLKQLLVLNSKYPLRCGENLKNAVLYLFIALNTVSIHIKDIPIFFGR